MRRAAALVLIALAAACASNTISLPGDMAGRDGSAVCAGDLGAVGHSPTACGSVTCPAGQICMIFTPGIPPPPDAGPDWGYSYSCVTVPAACACSSGCGPHPSPAGCFSALCQGEPDCSFDGATLTCWGI